MKIETFSSFKDENLHSKKEWFFSDTFIFYMRFIIPFLFLLIFFDIYNSILNIKKLKAIILIAIIFITYIFSDLLTAIIHCCYIDNSFSKKEYTVQDGHIIIDTKVGYASCHHIFPSNWKDISDITILTSGLSFFFIPILLIYFCIRNSIIKLLFYFTILFLIFATIIHKYSHEKLHKRYVPFFIDVLLEYDIFLSPTKHQKHHIENNYNWAFLNGSSDTIFNYFIDNLCYYFKKCPTEESVKNVKKFVQENNNDNIVNIKFIGDIEGVIKCKLYDNLIIKPI
jgi:hypothetical protein